MEKSARFRVGACLEGEWKKFKSSFWCKISPYFAKNYFARRSLLKSILLGEASLASSCGKQRYFAYLKQI